MGLGLTAEIETASLFARAERETGWLFGEPEPAASLVEAKPLPRSMKPRIRLGEPLPTPAAPPPVQDRPDRLDLDAADEEHATVRTGGRIARERIVERILEVNPTVGEAFLDQFDTPTLHSYLDRLIALEQPRGRLARWIRTGDTPAILARERAD